MRGKAFHLRPLSRVPSAATTALELKLDAVLLYLANGLGLFNNIMLQTGAALVNTTGTLASSLPYKNATGGSSQGGGDGTGGDGTDGDGDGGGLF